MNLKAIMIVGSIVVVTALHYGVAPSHPALHLLHRELYFIPILLAGFWFGLRVALLTSWPLPCSICRQFYPGRCSTTRPPP